MPRAGTLVREGKVIPPKMKDTKEISIYGDKVPQKMKDPPPSVPNPNELHLEHEQEQELMKTLWGEYQRSLGARTVWMERQVRWHKKRFGIRPKKVFPWPGSSNLHLPLVDKSIRKLKPSFVGSLTNPVPIASFHDPNGKTMGEEPYLEQEFHSLVMDRMDSFEQFVVSADMTLEKGFCIAKVFYDYVTNPTQEVLKLADLPQEVSAVAQDGNIDALYQWLDSKGVPEADQPENADRILKALIEVKETVELKWHDVEYDAPRLVIRSPEEIVVPPDTKDIADARMVFDTYSLTGYDLKRAVAKGFFRKHVVKALLEKGGQMAQTGSTNPNGMPGAGSADDTQQYVNAHQSKTGIDPWLGSSYVFKMIESHTLVDVDDNGNDLRVVVIMAEDYPDEPLAVFASKKRKTCFRTIYFDKVNMEHFDHRGVSQMLDALQTALTVQHNLEIDRQTISTALGFKYVPGKVNPSQIRYIPGQGIAVNDLRNFEFITPPHMDGSFENQKAQLRALAEEYIGNIDFGLTKPGGQDSRTAAEVNRIAQDKQITLSLDIQIFLHCWGRVFEMIWEEWNDHGPRQFYASMIGRPPLNIDREGKIRGRMRIKPNGSLWNSNPLVELQKAKERLAEMAGNPYIRQMPLYEDRLMREDPRLVQRLLASPEEVQQNMQQLAMAAAQGGEKKKRVAA